LDGEALADELDARVEAAERSAMEADEWLARFQDTIMTLFSATPGRAAA
jgi:hypothetical protein